EGFGSSYEKARSAIEALLLHYPHRPLTVVFEPHTFSWRSRDALPWYDTVFEGVARVLMIPPPTHGAATHHQSSLEEILARTAAAGRVPTPYARALREDLVEGLDKLKAEPGLAEAVQAALADMRRRDSAALAALRDRLVAQERSHGRAD